ncbi:MAG: hypothetical protein ACPG9L_06590 [Crocinitomicaceae bacterium]
MDQRSYKGIIDWNNNPFGVYSSCDFCNNLVAELLLRTVMA